MQRRSRMETSVAKGEVQRYHKSLQEFLHRASLQGDEDGDTKLWVRRKTTEWYETRNDNANVDTSVYCLVYSSIRDEYKNVELFSAHFHDLLIWGGNMWFAWQPGWYQHALRNDRWGVFFHHALAFKHCLTSQYEKGEEEVGAPCVEMTSGQMEEKKKVACRKWQETCCYVGCGTTKLETGRWDTFKYCAKHVHFSFVRRTRDTPKFGGIVMGTECWCFGVQSMQSSIECIIIDTGCGYSRIVMGWFC